MNMLKTVATGLSAVMLAGSVMVSTAMAAPVEPKKVAFAIHNPNLGGCAPSLKISISVAAKAHGQVKVRIERKSDGVMGPWFPVNIVDNPAYGKNNALLSSERYVGKWQVAGAFGVAAKEQYRVIASGMGKTKKSGWSKLVSKC